MHSSGESQYQRLEVFYPPCYASFDSRSPLPHGPCTGLHGPCTGWLLRFVCCLVCLVLPQASPGQKQKRDCYRQSHRQNTQSRERQLDCIHTRAFMEKTRVVSLGLEEIMATSEVAAVPVCTSAAVLCGVCFIEFNFQYLLDLLTCSYNTKYLYLPTSLQDIEHRAAVWYGFLCPKERFKERLQRPSPCSTNNNYV